MKNNYFTNSLLSITIAFALFSCIKKEDTPSPTTTTSTSTNSGFTWKEDNGTAITADSAYWTTGTWGTGVRAFKNGMANYFEINWASQNNTTVGAKTLTVGYDFTFLKNTDTYIISSPQTLNITNFTDNKLSGNSVVAVSGGNLKSIEFTFTNLSKK